MKRLGVLMIVVLLNCFTSLLKANDENYPFTGEQIKADTTKTSVIIVPIEIIKEVNIKLTERLDLLELTKYQSKQIDNYKQLVEYNNNTINYYKTNLIEATNINESLNKEIKKEIRKTNIWKYTTVGVLAATVISIITISIIK